MNCLHCQQPIDLTTIPDDILAREWTRRIGLKRDPANAGRKKLMRACEQCGATLGARELRAHRARCPQKPEKPLAA